MFGHGRTWSAFAICLILAAQWCGGPLDAAEPRILELSGVATAATPIQDDANLYDVQFVGTKSGWAVGDHGVIWHTTDGGRNWRLVNSSVECPLRSVCFLTDRMGWIVGGGTTPYTRIGYGVVLFTSNGGASWQRLAQHALPQLLFVKFFDRQQGIAVGEATSEHPTGVLTTNDGGKTWQAAVGKRHSGWRAADFLGPEVGVVAGSRGRVLLFGSGRLLEPRIGQLGLRGLRGVKLQRDEAGGRRRAGETDRHGWRRLESPADAAAQGAARGLRFSDGRKPRPKSLGCRTSGERDLAHSRRRADLDAADDRAVVADQFLDVRVGECGLGGRCPGNISEDRRRRADLEDGPRKGSASRIDDDSCPAEPRLIPLNRETVGEPGLPESGAVAGAA